MNDDSSRASLPAVPDVKGEEVQRAYGRGVTAGKLEALQYTPEERERYGKWVAQSEALEKASTLSDDVKIQAFGDLRECLAAFDYAAGELQRIAPTNHAITVLDELRKRVVGSFENRLENK